MRPATLRRTIAALVVVSLAGCLSSPSSPLHGPVEAMGASWGPFSRQCSSTQISHFVARSRLSPSEVQENHTSCTRFSAQPAGNGATAITATISVGDQGNGPQTVHFIRTPSGIARAVKATATGLLAQEPDDPNAAIALARRIGLTERQMIAPDQTLVLPIRILLPSATEVQLSCQTDGQSRIRDRAVLVLACTGSKDVNVDSFAGELHLAGVAEIDVQSGVRLAIQLFGRISGDGTSQHADQYRLRYSLDTEFE